MGATIRMEKINVTNAKQVNNATMCYISRSILLKPKSLRRTTLRNALNVVSNGTSSFTTVDGKKLI